MGVPSIVLKILLAVLFAAIQPAYSAFVPSRISASSSIARTIMSAEKPSCPNQGGIIDLTAHPSTLPGDPSLILTTNVDLGDKKMDIMKGEIEGYRGTLCGCHDITS
mmetsp:Transcript_27632/g.55820  ORF Transcript_27632/g.55820 Transcript_27632/m.55820 type:complete len:107 (+) Transcript_27632:112-432(+)